MQDVTQQDSIEAVVSHRKVTPIIRNVINASGSAFADVQTNDGRAEHALKMMRDKSAAAADVEHVSSRRQHAGHFKRHVICSTNFSSSSFTLEATFDGCS
jgi:hypothetical protein